MISIGKLSSLFEEEARLLIDGTIIDIEATEFTVKLRVQSPRDGRHYIFEAHGSTYDGCSLDVNVDEATE